MVVNFYNDYVDAINFACGLNRARIDSKYKLPYNVFQSINETQTREFYEQI